MKLNKRTSYVLLYLLEGICTSTEIVAVSDDLDIRTVQRALMRLHEMGLVDRQGPSNNPNFSVNYDKLLLLDIDEKLLIDEKRPETRFSFELLEYLENNLGDVDTILPKLLPSSLAINHDRMSVKELEHLTIELSWKSSAMEGNTYTLLDTELLLKEGIKAKNRTEFETQMILNHKEVVGFILDNQELFVGKISFSTIEQMHRIIGKNLGIGAGVRNRLVRISSSNYIPMTNPHQIREAIDRILAIISMQKNSYIRTLLALSLVPYLQTFEDGNKRTGRMLANAILISIEGFGFSLRKVETRDLAIAYLAFYEFHTLKPLAKIFNKEIA